VLYIYIIKQKQQNKMTTSKVTLKLIEQGISTSVKSIGDNLFRVNNISEKVQQSIINSGFTPVSLNWSEGGYLTFKKTL
jgi:hypothetical protein